MPKDASYHRAAIQYNEELSDFALALSGRLEHEEVARWSRSVAKQHAFHAGRHKKALQKIESHGTAVVETEDGGEDRVIDDEHVVHQSSVSGKYVSEEFAEKHPKTTFSHEVPNHPRPQAPVVNEETESGEETPNA